jgi:hypothetical protein
MTFEEWYESVSPTDDVRQSLLECWNAAQAAERGACLAICQDPMIRNHLLIKVVANLIRERGKALPMPWEEE